MGVQRGKKRIFWGRLQFKLLFCQPVPMNPIKFAEEVYLGHQISSQNIDRKILFLKKIKIYTRWLSRCLGLFLAISRLIKFSKASE